MNDKKARSGPILRLFQVKTKPGCAEKLVENFAVTSANVVLGEPGNQGYFFGQDVAMDDDYVVFASIWESLDAIQTRFGEAWQTSFLPEGYEDMIEDCSIRHIDVGAGWFVNIDAEP